LVGLAGMLGPDPGAIAVTLTLAMEAALSTAA
jgi:hypothetical protein